LIERSPNGIEYGYTRRKGKTAAAVGQWSNTSITYFTAWAGAWNQKELIHKLSYYFRYLQN